MFIICLRNGWQMDSLFTYLCSPWQCLMKLQLKCVGFWIYLLLPALWWDFGQFFLFSLVFLHFFGGLFYYFLCLHFSFFLFFFSGTLLKLMWELNTRLEDHTQVLSQHASIHSGGLITLFKNMILHFNFFLFNLQESVLKQWKWLKGRRKSARKYQYHIWNKENTWIFRFRRILQYHKNLEDFPSSTRFSRKTDLDESMLQHFTWLKWPLFLPLSS